MAEPNTIALINHIAYNIRVDCLRMTTQAGSGHITSSLSAADIIAALFFHVMKFDPNNRHNPDNDRFILSKGHAAPVLYAAWKELGILSEQDILGYRTFNSPLEGHPTARFDRFEAATGSLGQGLSIASGIAYAGNIDQRNYYTYCLLGDSETTEGSVWEAAEIAAFYKLDHLIAILDVNRLGQSTQTIHGHHVEQYARKFEAFGWHTSIVDGHDVASLVKVFEQAKNNRSRPTIIIAKTFKGYGIKKAEDKENFHGVAFKKEELSDLLKELEERFSAAAHYKPKVQYQPSLPTITHHADRQKAKKTISKDTLPSYNIGESVATRKAYGQAIAALGESIEQIVCLDAEVKNSTFAEIFEKQHPKRFIQCFITEQNMVSMAVGFANRGKIPFVSTFGVFFTRAFDQIRMAAIGRAPLRLVGSHAGVSIGQDGPSQMALEDIAMFASIDNSVILYPCDAVSTTALVALMADRNDGITYLRTTRGATPVIYEQKSSFTLGGCHILKQSEQDVACIVTAGITIYEALKAYEQLKKEGIMIAIIDAYSIKPLAHEIITQVAKKAHNRVITVEDHYLCGGLGQLVTYALRNQKINITCLAVTQMPRSGTPEDLFSFEHIDAAAIIKAIRAE